METITTISTSVVHETTSRQKKTQERLLQIQREKEITYNRLVKKLKKVQNLGEELQKQNSLPLSKQMEDLEHSTKHLEKKKNSGNRESAVMQRKLLLMRLIEEQYIQQAQQELSDHDSNPTRFFQNQTFSSVQYIPETQPLSTLFNSNDLAFLNQSYSDFTTPSNLGYLREKIAN